MMQACGCWQGAWHSVTPPPMCDYHAGRRYEIIGYYELVLPKVGGPMYSRAWDKDQGWHQPEDVEDEEDA